MKMLRPAIRIAMCVAVVWAGADLASAQERGQRGGGRGGFRGGFGGAGGKVFYVGNPQVQTELKITDDQKTKLEEVSTKYREETRNLVPRDTPREERQKKFQETADQRRKLTTDAEAKVDEILTSDQKKRLDEIMLQQQGTRALTTDKVAEGLGISAEQKTKIETILREQAEKQRELFTGADRQNFAETREKMQKLREETENQVAGVLTAEQKTKWEEMKGKPFEFRFGGRGQGNRPRRGGNNDNSN